MKLIPMPKSLFSDQMINFESEQLSLDSEPNYFVSLGTCRVSTPDTK
jgi:hypothetical protein